MTNYEDSPWKTSTSLRSRKWVKWGLVGGRGEVEGEVTDSLWGESELGVTDSCEFHVGAGN